MRISKYIKRFYNQEDTHFTEVLKGSFWAVIVLGATVSLQLLFDLFLARSVGANGSGIFYMALNLLLILALILRLGTDQALIRFVSPLYTHKKWAELRGLYQLASRSLLLLGVVGGLALFMLAPWIATQVFNEPSLTQYLRVFAVATPAFTLFYNAASILRGMKRTRSSLFVERSAVYMFGLAGALWLGSLYGLMGFFIAFTIAGYIAAFIGWWLIKRQIPTVRAAKPFSKRVLVKTSLPLLIVTFSNQMIARFDLLIIGAFLTASDAGIYGVALKISLLMSLALTAVNVINGPKVAELYHDKKYRALEKMVQKASFLSLLLALPIFFMMIIAPSFILSIFGSEFTAGTTVLIILAAGQLVNVATGSVEQILSLTGHERLLAKTVSAITLASIGLLIFMTMQFGIVGTAVAIAMTLVAKNIIYLILVRKKLGIWPVKFIKIGG